MTSMADILNFIQEMQDPDAAVGHSFTILFVDHHKKVNVHRVLTQTGHIVTHSRFTSNQSIFYVWSPPGVLRDCGEIATKLIKAKDPVKVRFRECKFAEMLPKEHQCLDPIAQYDKMKHLTPYQQNKVRLQKPLLSYIIENILFLIIVSQIPKTLRTKIQLRRFLFIRLFSSSTALPLLCLFPSS